MALAVVAAFSLGIAGPTTVASTPADFSVRIAPSRAVAGDEVVATLRLPSGVAAVDGRVFFDQAAAEFVGIAPLGGGTALYPEAIAGGVAFGAYDLRSQARGTILRFILVPQVAGSLQVRVLVDAAADASGRRMRLNDTARMTSVAVGGSTAIHAAPTAGARPMPLRPATTVTEQVLNGAIDQQDLAAVRGAWDAAALQGGICGATSTGDANGDGCVDIVDVQATLAALGTRTGSRLPTGASTASTPAAGQDGTPAYAHTWTVTSDADTADNSVGDGVCADSQNRCTLRAAMQEADWLPGNDLIAFDLPGTAPVTIQLGSGLPDITSLNGSVTIDGYTQPGSRVSTATVGSNAVPGVELRGNGAGVKSDAKQVALYITSGGNTVRGLVIDNIYRGIMLDGPNASNNVLVGNWLGFTRKGRTPSMIGDKGILLNTGANHNVIGTPSLADRNVIGNEVKGIDSYGPGTDYNTIQDNVFCIGPTGFTRAGCHTAIDHDFGPKFELIGGTAPNTRNVIGPTTNQGIEYSHGWNPNDASDTTDTWQVNGNQAIGNWVGFRGDGSYRANYRSGQLFATTDNGEGINVYDGSNQNLIEANTVAAVYAGIQLMSANATGNVVRGNVIGVSPLGEPAPLTDWGIRVRWGTTMDTVEANRISNAALGGIGLLNVDNLGNPIAVADNIRISQNIVTKTNGPAIYLAPTQSNPQTGANMLLPAPVITSALSATIRGTGIPGANVEVYRATRGATRFGLPDLYYGTTLVDNNGNWSLTLSVKRLPHRVTALQIAADQNTSALAANVKDTP